MKKFMNYLGEGVPGDFLHRIRRSQNAADFYHTYGEFLDHDQPMKLELIEAGSTDAPLEEIKKAKM